MIFDPMNPPGEVIDETDLTTSELSVLELIVHQKIPTDKLTDEQKAVVEKKETVEKMRQDTTYAFPEPIDYGTLTNLLIYMSEKGYRIDTRTEQALYQQFPSNIDGSVLIQRNVSGTFYSDSGLVKFTVFRNDFSSADEDVVYNEMIFERPKQYPIPNYMNDKIEVAKKVQVNFANFFEKPNI